MASQWLGTLCLDLTCPVKTKSKLSCFFNPLPLASKPYPFSLSHSASSFSTFLSNGTTSSTAAQQPPPPKPAAVATHLPPSDHHHIPRIESDPTSHNKETLPLRSLASLPTLPTHLFVSKSLVLYQETSASITYVPFLARSPRPRTTWPLQRVSSSCFLGSPLCTTCSQREFSLEPYPQTNKKVGVRYCLSSRF